MIKIFENMRFLKIFTFLFAIGILVNACSPKKSDTSYYIAKKENGDSAKLDFYTINNHFYGSLFINHKNGLTEKGTIQGEVLGTNYLGRFDHVSYSGARKISPIIFKKVGDTLFMGSGQVYTYMQIPYFKDETIHFDNNFVFFEVEK